MSLGDNRGSQLQVITHGKYGVNCLIPLICIKDGERGIRIYAATTPLRKTLVVL